MKQEETETIEPITVLENDKTITENEKVNWKTLVVVLLTSGLLMMLSWQYSSIVGAVTWVSNFAGENFYLFLIAGFCAQLIDGALGMAYGVTASSFLLSFGVPPAAASASIHTSEIFTSGVSGLMHLKFQNVNKKLFKTLLLPGVTGAIVGALTLSFFEQYNHILKPMIAIYMVYLGVLILSKAFRRNKPKVEPKNIPRLATFGGFMDSVGGGGWGPIVSSTLIAGGRNPRYTIGSVNLTEFFVALASSITFFSIIGIHHWNVIAGLILGGIVAAPIGAIASRHVPAKTLMIVIGIVVILLSIRILFNAFT